MATLTAIVIKDGNGASISGGIYGLDISDAGTGPWATAHVQLTSAGNAVAAFGSGTVSSAVQRVTIGTDDAVVTALQLIDNAVSGSGYNISQMGGVNVTMNTGAVGTGVQRVTLATDVALPAGNNNIGDVDVLTVITGTGSTNLGKAVDAVAGSTDTGVAILGIRDDVLTTLTPVDGDYTPIRLSSTGAVWVRAEPGDAQAILGTTTYTEATTAGVIIGAVRRDADTTLVNTTNEVSPLQVDALGRLKVEVFSGENLPIVGAAAQGAAVSGNPVLIGLEARSTAPTSAGTGNVARGLATLLAKQVTYPYALPAETWGFATTTGGVTNTSDTAAQAAGGAGVRHYVTSVQVVNAHTTTGTEVVIKDGATVLWRGWAEKGGGGVAARFDPPLRGTAATALNVANITTASQTYFNLQGFSAAE